MGKNNVSVTGRVSSHHSPPNCEPLFFFVFLEGAGCRAWLVMKVNTRYVTFYLINHLEDSFAGFQPAEDSR